MRLSLFAVLLAATAASAVAQDAPPRTARERRAIEIWAALPHDKQVRVLQRYGVTMSADYLSCVCRAAGYGSSSTSQFYHPDTIGEFNPMYSCSQPGPPCVVSGFGCLRYDLPSDPKLYEGCAADPAFAADNPLSALVRAVNDRRARTRITGSPITPATPPAAETPPDCDQARAEAGFAPPKVLGDVPPERMLYTLSPASISALGELRLPEVETQKLMAFLQSSLARLQDAVPFGDERDLRFDFGPVEIGASVDKQRRVHLSEIVFKTPVRREGYPDGLNGEAAVSLELAEPGEAGALAGHKPKAVKIGFSYEGKVELKYGIEITPGRTTDDYYDGDWQTESEYAVVRGIENVVSNLDFYAGGSAGGEVALPMSDGGTVNVGPEVTWTLKDRYSDWLFSDMNDALDHLLAQQQDWEARRRDYIRREAARFGIDARCFATGTTISLTRAAYEQQKAGTPGLEPPFASLFAKPKN